MNNPQTTLTTQDSYQEINDLKDKNLSFEQLKTYFTAVADKKGAKYAFDLLKMASLPPNTDLHLLGHVVGDILYKQQGATGIQICTQDFRNACSHSIVVGLFTDKGDYALDEINQACKNAPGGKGAYIMCYHGLGHGVLAFEGYDFEKTIDLCKKTASVEHDGKEYPECVSGAVMEIISGGGHDREIWLKQRPKYLKLSNPFYLCSPPLMPEEAMGRCLDYLTPFLWEAVGADINNPTESDFQKSFALCNQVEEAVLRNICFGGFGKEFIGLAASRDIRRVDQMSNTQLKKVIDWCNLAPNKGAVNECLGSALSSLYWGGENSYPASIRFCAQVTDSQAQRLCFHNLIGQVGNFIIDQKYRQSFCKDLPAEFKTECIDKLL